jgi:hypothetical protein
MPREDENPMPNGRITTQQFYEALLNIEKEMNEMELRILEKLDCIPGHSANIENLADKVDKLENKSNTWDGINSLGIVAGTIIGALFGKND